MRKNNKKSLSLATQTVRTLSDVSLDDVAGGGYTLKCNPSTICTRPASCQTA